MPNLPEIPVQPAPAPVQQTGAAPEGFIELPRYNGLVRKVQELTLANQDLNAQLSVKTSEIEQLKGQLSIKDVEKQVAVGERDTRLTTALSDLEKAQANAKELKSLQLKIKIAKDLNRPDLIKIADRIPSVDDEAVMKSIMEDFARFSDDAVKTRESQLLSGITPLGNAPPAGPAEPSSPQGWQDKVNSLPLGSKERAKAMNDYGDWVEKAHSK